MQEFFKKDISRFDFKNHLRKRSDYIFGRKTSLLKRRQLESDFLKDIFGPKEFIESKILEEKIKKLKEKIYETSDPFKKDILRGKVNFLKEILQKNNK